MSILLDAVTRAKQQEQPLDPVITPRAQYQAMQPKWPLALKFGLLGTALGGAVALAWLFSSQGPFSSSQGGKLSSESAQQPAAIQTQAAPKPRSESQSMAQPLPITQSRSPNPGVKLAGKVALPVPLERPLAQPPIPSRPIVTAQSSVVEPSVIREAEPVNSLAQVSAEEPIILGANTNQRGRELLNSLKAQVDEAAADVGLEVEPAPQQESEVIKPRQAVKDSSKLVAAFEAALKEVEKENAIATPVTEPKLDPIPADKPDDLPKYGQLPAGVQLQVPEFNILAHVYANDPNNRWLNVDGAELQQGDMIGGKLKIVEIRPRDVVLEVAGTEFKVPAI
ncbi:MULTISPECIES: general secretion pathway protein GspB [Shewanella]|uniref:General secretion pathway protein GspB n=1 Tax=Shewanella marisflavi TaxID=260364 RepID=A0ABX5WNY4_9GAMM|nr:MULTISPECIES: general secretion pathway protein GspB [Shewanella]QDF76215.1 general secretion pathway protein GspB [Shewanella marisflavi]